MELQGQTSFFVINIADIDIIILHRLNALNAEISIVNTMGYIKASYHQEIVQIGYHRKDRNMENNYMRSNLFIGASKEQLKECYESYKRIQCKRRNKKELFDDMQSGYIERIECDNESKRNIIAFSMAREHMFNEIARRYFKICDAFDELI